MPTRYRGTPREVQALDAFVKLARASTTLVGRLNQRLQVDHDLTESQLGVLEALLHLEPDRFTDRYAAFRARYGGLEDGHATDRVLEGLGLG